MTSICLSASFVNLLQRLFNAFSVFSISQHYVMAKKATVAFNVNNPDGVPPSTQELGAAGSGEDVGRDGVNDRAIHRKRVADSDANGALPRTPNTSDNPIHTETDTHENKRNKDKQTKTAKHNPQLFDSARAPRYPIVLCHGLYGFDVRGPESFPKLRMHYWSNVLSILKKVGAEVVVTGVPGTASISSRAERMDQFLQQRVRGRDINFVAHSMGGLDCRHLITHIRPTEYRSLSLTSLSVPHRGSPFMDWCMANIGIGSPRPFPFPSTSTLQRKPPTSTSHKLKRAIPYSLSSPLLSRPPPSDDTQSSSTFPSPTPSTASTSIPSSDPGSPTSTSASKLSTRLNILQSLPSLPSSFTSLILSLIDSPAYSNLTTSFLRDSFNPYTPDDPNVKYFSIAARAHKMSIWHPLWIPKMIVDAAEELESREEEALASQLQGQGHEMTLSHPHLSDFRGPKASSADTIRTVLKGNDGLVPISSAEWGTFLGVVEGCNHWDIRGTGGFGSVPGGEGDDSGNGNGSGNGDKGGGSGIGLNRIGLDFDWEEGWKVWRDWVGAVSGSSSESKTGPGNAAVAKEKTAAQTSALSALSASAQLGGSLSSDSLTLSDRATKLSKSGSGSWTALNGFSEGQRFDLERFYVALCRKLYDEGL